MDITGLSSAYFNEMMLDGGVNRINPVVNSLPNFEDLLKRTAAGAASQTEAPSTPKPSVMQAANTPSGKAAGVTIDKTDELYKQCLELEIFMVKTLISSMRNTVQKSGLIEEGFAGKMYEDMLYDEYARKYAENANLGMAELAYLELSGQRGKVVNR